MNCGTREWGVRKEHHLSPTPATAHKLGEIPVPVSTLSCSALSKQRSRSRSRQGATQLRPADGCATPRGGGADQVARPAGRRESTQFDTTRPRSAWTNQRAAKVLHTHADRLSNARECARASLSQQRRRLPCHSAPQRDAEHHRVRWHPRRARGRRNSEKRPDQPKSGGGGGNRTRVQGFAGGTPVTRQCTRAAFWLISGGSEVKHTGDGIMASFESVVPSIECAVTVQRRLMEHRRGSEHPLEVRIGISAGEPVTEHNDLFGSAVQLAARACASAEVSGILVSAEVRRALRSRDRVRRTRPL